LTAIYLKIEQYLVNEDPMQKFTKSLLRKTVKYRYEPLIQMANFGLIFEDEQVQEILLSQGFLKNLILKSNTIIGTADEKFLTNISEWVDHIPNVDKRPIPFDLKEKLPQTPAEWIPLMAKVSHKFYTYLENLAGAKDAASIFEKCYREIAESYRPLETFYVVVQLLPNNLLDENKIGLLNGEQIRNVFLNKVGHLQKTNEELFNKNNELKETQGELLVAQETALESVNLLHSVLNTVEEGIVTADSSGKIILVNEQIQMIFGYKEDELIGQNIQTLMPEKYREQHRMGMKRYLKTRESRAVGEKLVLEGLKKNGKVFPIELQITETQINEQIFFTAAMRDISAEIKNESELKKTYHDLRLSEQRYRSLMETTPDIVFTLSLDGIFTTLNSAFEKITAWPKEDWLGKPFTQLVHPDDSMPTLKIFQNVLQGHPTSLHEVRIRVKSGEYMTGEFSLTPQLQNGKMIGVLGIARDISKHKRNEKALHLSDDRYEKLLEMSSDGIVIFVEGKLTFINNSGLQIFRATEAKPLLNKSLQEFIHPHHQTDVKEWLKNVSEGSTDITARMIQLIGFDGEGLEVEVSAATVVYQKKPAIQLVFREISQGVPQEDTTVQNQVQFQEVLEGSPDAILITDLDNVILDANTQACRLYGGEHEALIGKDFLKLVSINLREATSQNIYLLMHGKRDYLESAHLMLDGSQFPVCMWAKRIEYAERPAVLLTVRDISNRKEMEGENETLSSKLGDTQHQAEALQAALEEAQQKIVDLQKRLKDDQVGSEDNRIALQELKTRLQAAQAKFQNAQIKIKKLGKMIPVCSSCKKIRDDEGFWRELDKFISNPTHAELLQSVCPDCETPVSVATENTKSKLE
jgi:PAS domain S-box-containing protein